MFSDDGDFIVSQTKDLLDTSHFPYRCLFQEVRTVLGYSLGDWLNINIAANLNDFKGEDNSAQLGKKIEEKVYATLTNSGIISSSDLKVKVIPTSFTTLEITLTILVRNALLTDKFTFSLEDQHAV